MKDQNPEVCLEPTSSSPSAERISLVPNSSRKLKVSRSAPPKESKALQVYSTPLPSTDGFRLGVMQLFEGNALSLKGKISIPAHQLKKAHDKVFVIVGTALIFIWIGAMSALALQGGFSTQSDEPEPVDPRVTLLGPG